MSIWNDLLGSMMRLAAPIMLIAYGGIFAFRIKVFPIVLEALMICGCFTAIVGAYLSNNMFVGMIVAMFCVMLLSLLYSVFVFELRANAIVSGYALYVIVNSLSRFLLPTLFGVNGRLILAEGLDLIRVNIAPIKDIPLLSGLLNNHAIVVYLAFFLSILVKLILYRSTFGLNMRATGENEEAASFANIRVKNVKYKAMAICGLFCGLGGAQLALQSELYKAGMTDGRGYVALAAIVLSKAEPYWCMLICLLYGLASALVVALSSEGYSAQLLSTIPYLMAIGVAVVPPLLKHLSNRLKISQLNRRIMLGESLNKSSQK